MSRFYQLLKHKFQPPLDPNTKFTNKTIIVTGSNTGIGYEAALKFVSLDAKHVILAVRDPSKGEQARRSIEGRCNDATGRGGRGRGRGRKKIDLGKIEVWCLDLKDYGSVRGFVKRVDEELERLDVVVLNAGIYMREFERSGHGWEKTLQVNVLSTALLGILLVPIMEEKRKRWRVKNAYANGLDDVDYIPVLEIVSSATYERATMSPSRQASEILSSLNNEETYSPRTQYATSKLLLMFVMQELASCTTFPLPTPSPAPARLSSTSTTALYSTIQPDPSILVFSVSPGFCSTSLFRAHNSLLARLLRPIVSALFLRTAEQGARSLVSGAALPMSGNGSSRMIRTDTGLEIGIGEVHGGFWQHDVVKK